MSKSIDASIVLLGCTSRGRLQALTNVVDSIESYDVSFKQKIITLDIFTNTQVPEGFQKQFEDRGWQFFAAPVNGMVNNLTQGLAHATQDWVFYVEDDVFINKLPTKDQFCRMMEIKSEGRPPGIISYTYGGYEFKRISRERLQISTKDLGQYRKVDDFLYWIRDESMNYGYHVEFPVTFFRTDLLRQCLAHAKEHCIGRFIESALTTSWFSLGFDKEYHKGTLLKYDEDIIREIQETMPKDYYSLIMDKNRDLWSPQNLQTTPGRKIF